MALGDDPDSLFRELKKRFAHARLTAPSREFKTTVEHIAANIEKPSRKCEITLDLHGTPFQKLVWQGLTTVPGGSTLPYKELAKRIGHPGSARAVANACGANPVAVIIPCHRVIRTDGSPGGYRWGIDRKETLLSREQNTPTQENQ